jgi:hypothetical protein
MYNQVHEGNHNPIPETFLNNTTGISAPSLHAIKTKHKKESKAKPKGREEYVFVRKEAKVLSGPQEQTASK